MKLIDNAKDEFHRLWSIRFSIWFAVFTAVASCVCLFGDYFNPFLLLGVCVFANLILIPLARLMKQKELPKP